MKSGNAPLFAMTWIITLWLIGIVVLLLSLSGCACNCEDEMSKERKAHGNPEEITSYSSRNYNSTTWWYWTKGVSYTFTWGKNVKGCCDVSTYRFSPIGKDATAEEKAAVAEEKVLESTVTVCPGPM